MSCECKHHAKQPEKSKQCEHKTGCHAKRCEHIYPSDGVVPNKGNSQLLRNVDAANTAYSVSYVPQPNIAPSLHAAVLTCMDARIVPDEALGFKSGEFHVIRNAGGRANEDSIRSLIISTKLLGTNQWFVIHHTDCGMQKFTQEVMDELLSKSLATATLVKNCNTTMVKEPSCKCKWENTEFVGCWRNKSIDWQTINCGQKESVCQDIKTIRSHPGVPSWIPIYGGIFDVLTGQIVWVDCPEGKAVPMCL